MVGPYFYSDDPVRDAAEYYEWLDEYGVTADESTDENEIRTEKEE